MYKIGKDMDKRLNERSLFRLFFRESLLHVDHSGENKLQQELQIFW